MAGPVRVALALGSGGARGNAHIGAVQVLEERGAEIVTIAGSSMGALVGGVRAAGHLDDLIEWMTGLRQRDVVRMLDPSLSAPGAIRGEKIMARVRELLDGARIEDLPIPYTAVATDLLGRREVWFQRGPADTAIRASIAIPGVITPVVLNGRLLADGGIMNPVPLAPTAAAGADLTVAVSLLGEPREAAPAPPVQETSEPRPMEEWTERFRSGAAHLLDRDVVRAVLHRFGGSDGEGGQGAAGDGDGPALLVADAAEVVAPDGTAAGPVPPVAEALVDAVFEELPAGLGRADVMSHSIDAMQSLLIRYRMAGYPPDVLVTVPRDACRSLDYHRAAEMIELGRTLTIEALDRAEVLPAPS
ncbi:MAG TPA: patatin-like phospholipase family protein [Acidimicrobiales bacterium]|nr:patatin-like phospholipase family protein [Acidimicrobiales bacterium]